MYYSPHMKDYSLWHQQKTSIEHSSRKPLFREREIWWCSLGMNIGTEQDGKNHSFERPLLVLQKFNADLFWGIPMTTANKHGRHYKRLSFRNFESTLILSQLRTWSSKRLLRRIGRISHQQFISVQDSLADLIKKSA